jgi:hypothetical protein
MLPNVVAFKLCMLEVPGLNIDTQTNLTGVQRFPSVVPGKFQDNIANYVLSDPITQH